MSHILIVEDDTDINNSTAEYLRRQGCLCSQAFSGTEGRRLWQAGGIDLLLIDLMLPGLSGRGLITEIRQSSRTPVIVLSAKTELSDKVELLGQDIGAAPPRQRRPHGSPFALPGLGAEPGRADLDRRRTAGEPHRPRV